LYRVSLEVAADGTPQNVLQSLLQEFSIVLEASVFMIDRQNPKDETILAAVKGGNDAKSGFRNVQIYSKYPGFCCNSVENRVRIQGVIESVVLAHPKATIKTVRELISNDLLYSLKNRLEYVSDGFMPEENPFLMSGKTACLQLPKRVRFTLSNCLVTGYTLADVETLQQVVGGILSAKVLIADTKEGLPEVRKEEGKVDETGKVQEKRFWYLMMAVFAILIFSFFMRNTG
jgi:hypothetical protein